MESYHRSSGVALGDKAQHINRGCAEPAPVRSELGAAPAPFTVVSDRDVAQKRTATGQGGGANGSVRVLLDPRRKNVARTESDEARTKFAQRRAQRTVWRGTEPRHDKTTARPRATKSDGVMIDS
jgi:hypothetical protein